jgi:MarR family transcriptional regulator, transcriptional regulator for hemolysin
MIEIATHRRMLTSTLLQAGRQWRRLAEQAFAEHDISEARGAVLIWASRLGGGVRQNVLAGAIGIEGPSLVRLLDQLAASGHLERRDDPVDRRAKTIWLTDEGERLAEELEAELQQLRDHVLVGVGEDDILATLRVFRAIDRAAAGQASAELEGAAS